MNPTKSIERQQDAPREMRGWRYPRRLCIAIVLSLAIFNASITPPAQAEGDFQAPAIVTVVLVFALTYLSMLGPFRDLLASSGNQRPATYDWNGIQVAQTTLLIFMVAAVMAPIVRLLTIRNSYRGSHGLMLATAMLLSSPFAIPPSTQYAE